MPVQNFNPRRRINMKTHGLLYGNRLEDAWIGKYNERVRSGSKPLWLESVSARVNRRGTHHAHGKGSKACKAQEHEDTPVAVEQGINTESENCCAGNKRRSEFSKDNHRYEDVCAEGQVADEEEPGLGPPPDEMYLGRQSKEIVVNDEEYTDSVASLASERLVRGGSILSAVVLDAFELERVTKRVGQCHEIATMNEWSEADCHPPGLAPWRRSPTPIHARLPAGYSSLADTSKLYASRAVCPSCALCASNLPIQVRSPMRTLSSGSSTRILHTLLPVGHPVKRSPSHLEPAGVTAPAQNRWNCQMQAATLTFLPHRRMALFLHSTPDTRFAPPAAARGRPRELPSPAMVVLRVSTRQAPTQAAISAELEGARAIRQERSQSICGIARQAISDRGTIILRQECGLPFCLAPSLSGPWTERTFPKDSEPSAFAPSVVTGQLCASGGQFRDIF
ncbi:hypothetical protein B0H13DRAFT_1867675 [Mycena leptocephala]|nr:hypothetical protein B0H13DRAFT_1867675 [Mycena leptocephala]